MIVSLVMASTLEDVMTKQKNYHMKVLVQTLQVWKPITNTIANGQPLCLLLLQFYDNLNKNLMLCGLVINPQNFLVACFDFIILIKARIKISCSPFYILVQSYTLVQSIQLEV